MVPFVLDGYNPCKLIHFTSGGKRATQILGNCSQIFLETFLPKDGCHVSNLKKSHFISGAIFLRITFSSSVLGHGNGTDSSEMLNAFVPMQYHNRF
jgi:hypothetical protein